MTVMRIFPVRKRRSGSVKRAEDQLADRRVVDGGCDELVLGQFVVVVLVGALEHVVGDLLRSDTLIGDQQVPLVIVQGLPIKCTHFDATITLYTLIARISLIRQFRDGSTQNYVTGQLTRELELVFVITEGTGNNCHKRRKMGLIDA